MPFIGFRLVLMTNGKRMKHLLMTRKMKMMQLKKFLEMGVKLTVPHLLLRMMKICQKPSNMTTWTTLWNRPMPLRGIYLTKLTFLLKTKQISMTFLELVFGLKLKFYCSKLYCLCRIFTYTRKVLLIVHAFCSKLVAR